MEVETPFVADMTDIPQLQGTCNTWERNHTAKLISLVAKPDAPGGPATIATFRYVNSGLDQLGKVRLTAGGTHTAYIKGVSTAITISRA